MVEARQDLTFGVETPDHLLCVDSRVQQLDRDLFLKITVCARCEVDASHSATPDLAGNDVGADALADLRVNLAPNPSRGIFRACFQIVVRASPQNFRLFQERLSLLQQRPIVGTGALHKRSARVYRVLLKCIT